MAEQEQFDTEITLGVGRLLVLFFGLVVLCGIFMGVGYSLGRSSAKIAAANEATAPSTLASNEAKPGAAGSVIKPPDSTSQSASNLSFYKSVEQKEPDAQLNPAEPEKPESKPIPAPEIKAGAVPGSGYMVQIAAVSKKEDADALVDALRHKQYPVFVTSVPGDKLFHVQIGPFADTKDAESMRSRLMADGYNPILKR